MMEPTVAGVEARMVESARLTTRVLFAGPEDGIPVLFLHGNLSSATWWEENLDLGEGFLSIAPDQRGYGDADRGAKIDATRGMGDLADDAFALMDTPGHDRFHLVGNSLGGSVVWWMMVMAPERILSVTQAAPGSPYGFGGTRDVDGTPTTPDFAGTGAGLVNPEMVRRIAEGDDSTESPFSPRSALRALVWGPPFIPEREDALVAATLAVHVGEDGYPGDAGQSPHWPFVTPGTTGPNNGLSPAYPLDIDGLVTIEPKPPILWVRGSADLAVSDSAASDPGTWGPMGIVPGYPGADAYPPQPMVGQTRAVLDRYAANGGAYVEEVFEGNAHVPFIEDPGRFNRILLSHLQENGGKEQE